MRRTAISLAAAATSVIVLAACTSGLETNQGETGDTSEVAAPSGERIVFTRQDPGSGNDVLYAMDPDGTHQTELVPNCCPHVSPDGSRIVVHAHFDSNPWVLPAVLDADGSGYTVIRSADSTLNLGPGPWSPDGERIAAQGFEDYKDHIERNGLYTLTPDGEDLVRVTRSGERPDRPVAFSPDGTKILFFRPVKAVGRGDASMNLYSVNTDGSNLHQLNPPGTTTGLPSIGPSASWSPDGRQVSFVASQEKFWEKGAPRAVFVASADGADPQRITPWSTLFSAQWSPDGDWIAFTMPNPDFSDVFIAHPDGSELTEVTASADGSFAYGPVWSPDGTHMLFFRGSRADATRTSGLDVNHTDLWIANVDGTGLEQLTNITAEYEQYAWTP